MPSDKDRDRLRKIVTGAVLKKGNDMSRYEVDRFIDNTPTKQHREWIKEHVDKGNVD